MFRFIQLIPLAFCTLRSEAAPQGTYSATSSSSEPYPTNPYASNDPNLPLWTIYDNIIPQPIRGPLGATILGPQNVPIAIENPSLLAPPTTDHGTVPNAKWPFALSHNRLQRGGWARQQTVDDMPIATGLAGVNMRLEAGAIRELHWHTAAEWAYVIKLCFGTSQITIVTPEGQNYVANVNPGDVWYFPPGQPHSIQATATDPEGTEFLLVFPDGSFNEDSTFLLTDWLAHVPKEVIAKNFGTDTSSLNHLPGEELYIFPSDTPPINNPSPTSPEGTTSQPYTYAFSQVQPTQHSGGTVKILDSRTFKVSTGISVADVTVEPGAMRELHWHPTEDEWTFFLEGSGRISLFAAQSNARTFDYQAGDIAYIPKSYGHYVENTGNTTLHFLEIYNSDRFQDVSLTQWLALIPPALVKAHLNLSDETIEHLSKTKSMVVKS
ncbi:oxalate decarboxylase [Abortiporus biennis]|nr:oxalate decarboxylase [Abortiporus biennis]